MNIRNKLYRLQYRSVKNLQNSQLIQEQQQKKYQKQLKSIDTSLEIMYSAFVTIFQSNQRNNMKMQEIYLDLIKARGRNVKIRGKDIKNVYQLLSENKTKEITFQQFYQKEQKQRKQREQTICSIWTPKQGNNTKTKDLMILTLNKTLRKLSTEESQMSTKSQQKLSSTTLKQSYQQLVQQQEKQQQVYYTKIILSNYKRLYSRLIEVIMKKLTYYILNKNRLYELIMYSIAEISRRLQTLLRRINDIKDTKIILDMVKIIFDENLIIQQKIYEALVNEGHVVSIQEFFRVSGKMMQQPIISQRRNSRISVVSGKLSVISSKSSENQNQECQAKKNSRFYQHHKGVKKRKSQRTSQKIGFIKKASDSQKSERQQKNVTHFERIHKEIEFKYVSALDKISDLMLNNEYKNQYQQQKILNNENNLKYFQTDNSVIQNKENSSEVVWPQIDEQKKENIKRKATVRKTTSAFQYFSSSFKKIINELDEKKGKIQNKVQNNQKSTANTTPQLDQTLQMTKITNQTISLKNPLNVARLLGKRFKTIASSQFTYINKSKHLRNMARQKTQINNLLKIYQNSRKQNYLVDILFDEKNDNNISKDYLKMQKDQIKKGLTRKMKQKKSKIVNGSKDKLTKQVKDKYGGLLTEKNEKQTKLKRQELQDQFNDNLIEEVKQKCESQSLKDKNEKDTLQKIQQRQQTEIQQNTLNQSVTNNSKIFIKEHNKKFDINVNHQSLTKKTSLEMTNIQKVYNEFSNPLTTKYGFYNDQIYRSLRNSLQKCQINTIKLKKCAIKQEDLLVIRKNVSFGENSLDKSIAKRKQQKSPQIFKIQHIRTSRRSHPNLISNKSSPPQTFQNNFYLTSCPISIKIPQTYSIKSKDISKFVEQCFQQNNFNSMEIPDKQKNLQFRQISSTTILKKSQSLRKIQSTRNTPRNSCGKRNQVYSINRRKKIQ